MDRVGVVASHGDGHAPDAARQGPAAQYASPMKRLHRRPFLDPELAQALGFTGREEIPFDMIDEGRLAQR